MKSLREPPVTVRVYAGTLRGTSLVTRGCRSHVRRDGVEIADGWEPRRSLVLHAGDRLLIGDADLTTDEYGFVVTPAELAIVDGELRVVRQEGVVADGRVHVIEVGRNK
jgi:hypothetical protein